MIYHDLPLKNGNFPVRKLLNEQSVSGCGHPGGTDPHFRFPQVFIRRLGKRTAPQLGIHEKIHGQQTRNLPQNLT